MVGFVDDDASQRLAESSRKAPSRRLMKSTEAMTRGSALQGLEPASSDRRASATPSLSKILNTKPNLDASRLPLLDDGSRADDQNPRGTAAGIQFPQNEAGLDRFAEAQIVGDEEARAR